MLVQFALLLGGLIALYVGGEFLVRAAVLIGQTLGISTLVVGLTIVAFGTSAPELAVSVDAALVGSTDIAMANVVGSNFANIALVLALSALLMPMTINKILLQRDLMIMMLGFGALCLALVDGVLSRIEGGLFLVALVVYLLVVIKTNDSTVEIDDEKEPYSVVTMVLSLALGIVLLATGGHLLVKSAIEIASAVGVSEAVIGMTVVSIGTSLPEITASLISILRGHSSMAVGNIVGSNIWNTFGVLGTTSLILPLEQGGVTSMMLGAMVATGLLLWIFCRTRFELSRLEGGLLLAIFLGGQVFFLV